MKIMKWILPALGLGLTWGLTTNAHNADALKVTSATVKSGAAIQDAQVFNGFGCSGQNISPDISWSGAPKDTKAFAVTMFDPDAPTGSGWWHWLVVNLPATTTHLDAGASGKLPEGALEVRTDFGKPGYGGPCPPPGDKPHHYVIKVFALKDKIPVTADASGAMVGFNANHMKLAEGTLTATYGRTK